MGPPRPGTWLRGSATHGTVRPLTTDATTTTPDPEAAAHTPRRAQLPIVAVALAAADIDTLLELLDELSGDVGLAIVVLLHPLPAPDPALLDHLTGRTRLRVVVVAARTELAADHIYVAAPGQSLGLVDGALVPGPPPPHPIDRFFAELAQSAEHAAIGVVLSGPGFAGALGLREIKSVGGITLAQDPESAVHASMPTAAIATGAVDLVATPARIARELQRIGHHPYVRPSGGPRGGDELLIAPEQLHRIFTLLRNVSGVDFTHYKPPTIRRRLQRRMVVHKFDSVELYIKYLRDHPEETTRLYQDLLIHVTRFFRDPESFRALVAQVFPSLLANRRDAQPLRIWLPGCSTGEEAYSLAIALLEFLGDDAGATPIQIFATDVSESSVEQARSGLYPETVAADLSPERLRRYFTRCDDKYRIAKPVRDLCVFARQDVTRDPPFSRLDLILCRNVLIYMGAVLQRKLMSVFHYALKPSGFLMLGGAESVGAQTELFAVVDKKHRIFTKKPIDTSVSAHIPIEYTLGRTPLRGSRITAEMHPSNSFQTEANRLILDSYGPAGVIIDADFQIIHFRGKTGAYLEPAPGEAAQSLNLLKMAREGLQHGLQTALYAARKSEAAVRKDGLTVQYEGRSRAVNLQVIPLQVSGESRHYVVLFEEATREPPREPCDPQAPASPDDDRFKHLQEELAASREYLQSIIQDLEAANEELQSANEEILSSNEELQSTNEELDTAKEELQSTNEELNTVNDELHGRNDELSRVNSDLVNLLGCVEIAIVIVGADLSIRRFTPMAEKVLNLIPTDIGRPISQIKPNIECPGLEKLIGRVIDTVTTHETTVRDSEGAWFTLRIRPYKNLENRIDGAVLALFDVASRRADPERRQTREQLRFLAELVRDPLLLLDGELRVQFANAAFHRCFGAVSPSPEPTAQPHVRELGGGRWLSPRLRELLAEVLARPSRHTNYNDEHDYPGVGRKRLRIDAARVDGSDPDNGLIAVTFREIEALS